MSEPIKTDRQKWVDFLGSFGIPVESSPEQLTIEADASGRTPVDGYSGFCVHIYFDSAGKLKGLGIWE